MATKKLEKKEELGTQIQLGAIIKNANKKKNIEESIPEKKEKFYPMPVKVTVNLWDNFTNSYYELVKELGDTFVSITRSDVFISLITYMDKVIDIDTSNYPNLYDEWIGAKGKRSTNSRTPARGEKVQNYCWANFTFEQLLIWKRLLSKLAIREGIERRNDFSKQYFMVDIIEFFSQNIKELADEIKHKKL